MEHNEDNNNCINGSPSLVSENHNQKLKTQKRVNFLLSHLFPRIHQFESCIATGKQSKSNSFKNSSNKKREFKFPLTDIIRSLLARAGKANRVYRIVRALQGCPPLSTASLQAFNNILFLVNSIPPSLNSLSIFDIMLRSAPSDGLFFKSDLLRFLSQVKIPKSALGGTDYKTFITTLSRVQPYLPRWYYASLVLAKSLNNFDDILLFCAQRFSRDTKIRSALTGALVYPAMMLILSLGGLTYLLTKVLPNNVTTFESLGLTVPDFMQFFLYLIYCVQYHWFALLILIPWSLSSRLLPFRTFMQMQYIKLHTPIGHLSFLQDKATFLHMLSLLDKEQMSSKLILVNTNVSGNPVLQDMLENMASKAKGGASADEILSYLLDQKHIFSPYEIAYLKACFLSGKHSIIQDGLRYVSQMVLKEYTSSLQNLISLLSPLSTLIVGIMVGLIVILGVFPLTQLANAIR